jgi:hypothetical protein
METAERPAARIPLQPVNVAEAIDRARGLRLSTSQVCETVGLGFTTTKLDYFIDAAEEAGVRFLYEKKQRTFTLDDVAFIIYFAWNRATGFHIQPALERAIQTRDSEAELLESLDVAKRLVAMGVRLEFGQVTQVVGISKVQLDYWTKTAEITTDGNTQRLYRPREVAQLLLINQVEEVAESQSTLLGTLHWGDLPYFDGPVPEPDFVSVDRALDRTQQAIQRYTRPLAPGERGLYFRHLITQVWGDVPPSELPILLDELKLKTGR